MTSQGSAHGRFQRALKTGNPLLAVAAAAEMPHVSLADALALTLVLRESEPAKYERAALRWHARLVREVRALDVAEAQLALAALQVLGTERPLPGARALTSLLEGHIRTTEADVLSEWIEAQS